METKIIEIDKEIEKIRSEKLKIWIEFKKDERDYIVKLSILHAKWMLAHSELLGEAKACNCCKKPVKCIEDCKSLYYDPFTNLTHSVNYDFLPATKSKEVLTKVETKIKNLSRSFKLISDKYYSTNNAFFEQENQLLKGKLK